ncbi:SgcJ/EcaC family oxidoreductase [Paenarthrobacter aurescens]|uniref:SgcJ/EcaC family oxidoreductase n=1 Tax=Paenarthrobacter aurescens TaxID=43663 RepID=UPI0021C162C0|nr:SgcJ/EcaC family oxidoreductase [Paenarthrobacter aurescens]MCT9869688.1 SgcJ/EcaC family oxidoreductase [Paenarthrobacter aurescens]
MTPSPRDVADGFARAWNVADPVALAGLFVEDADFVNVVGMWWNNRRQIQFNHDYGFRHMFPDTEMVLEKVKVRELGSDAAVVHARWFMTGQITPAGERSGPRRGVISFTAVRQSDGRWLAVSAQNTDVVPGMQTHVATGEGIMPESYEAPPAP